MTKKLRFPNTVVRFQILLASLVGEIVTMFDKSQTCKYVAFSIANWKADLIIILIWPLWTVPTGLEFHVLVFWVVVRQKKYEYCANENLTTGNLLINVVIFIFPLANLEELKILAE